MVLSPQTHRYIISTIFIVAGILHFVKPKPYANIIPDFLPFHLALVYVSGLAEILGGIGILTPQTRIFASWGLIALLIAVFPANINMAIDAIKNAGYWSWYSLVMILRLPLQFVLIYWIFWASLG